MRVRKLLLVVGAALLGLAAPANAADVEVIAHGLDNPRHLAFGDHHLFVAESGSGGAGPCQPGPEETPVCVGDTGAVTVIDRDGQRRIVEGLASLADEGTGNTALGPHGVFVKHHRLLITNGGPDGLNRDVLAAANPVADLFGRVLSIHKDGGIDSVADIWGFERDNNPDAAIGNPAVDSNPVDVLADRGRLIVADAGGNSLLKVKKNGEIKVLTLFPNRDVPDPFGGTEPIPMQAVPTGVVKGPDGDYFMTQLTGFPFPVGGANVYRIDPKTGAAEVFASGFTNLMDLAFDEDGTLWVLEIDHDSLLTPNPEGAIYSIDADGNATQLELPPGTLTHPGGITVGEDGALYVTNKADMAGVGEVLRITLDEDTDHDDSDDDKEDDDD
jgi:sugar lactone lactonase YvrE